MERKIGEIFEFGGEWYQCVNTGFSCADCDIKGDCSSTYIGACSSRLRKDGKQVRFKKLEKVGEPYYSKYYGKFYQKYITYIPAVGYNFKVRIEPVEHVSSTEIYVELKQKEDMEEKKVYESKLKTFNLELAKQGKPVCTRDGHKARIICFDKQEGLPIVALVETNVNGRISEEIALFYIDGRAVSADIDSKLDLMMSPEKKEGWVNIVRGSDGRPHMGRGIFQSKEEAENAIKAFSDNLIDIVKISWEEQP